MRTQALLHHAQEQAQDRLCRFHNAGFGKCVFGGPSPRGRAALTAALDYFVGDEPEHARRPEASCELGRARVLQDGRAEDWQRIRECLPIYRAWGLADREVVAAIERLVSRPVQFSE